MIRQIRCEKKISQEKLALDSNLNRAYIGYIERGERHLSIETAYKISLALMMANEVFRTCETIGYPECRENLAHGVVYLAKSPKDRSAYEGYLAALADVQQFGNLPIPLNLRNAETNLMKEIGYGKGYEMYTKEDLLPDKLKGKKYFKPIIKK